MVEELAFRYYVFASLRHITHDRVISASSDSFLSSPRQPLAITAELLVGMSTESGTDLLRSNDLRDLQTSVVCTTRET